MRQWGALVPVLLGGVLAGCAGPESARTVASTSNLRAPAPATGIVQLDVALLERPVADPFINKELWEFTDEQIVDLEHKAAVDDNGFRVGQIVGMAPGRLQALLTSERSCINPRRRLLPVGQAAAQMLGPTLVHSSFKIKKAGQPLAVSLDQVQFALEVVPTLTSDGRACLRFTPKAHYGESLPDLKPAADGSNWTFQLTKPCQTFAEAGWEVKLAPNEFLVVGASLDHPQTLGYQAFVQEGPQPVQRLLVIRTSHCGNGSENDPTLEDIARSGQSLPLALQATRTAVRARGQ